MRRRTRPEQWGLAVDRRRGLLLEGLGLHELLERYGSPLHVAGTYFVPYQTNFSFPRPAIVMVEDGRARLLRRAERFADLVAFDS